MLKIKVDCIEATTIETVYSTPPPLQMALIRWRRGRKSDKRFDLVFPEIYSLLFSPHFDEFQD